MTASHGTGLHGIQRAAQSVRDPLIRAALTALTDTSNYDPESITLRNGKVKVRREWVEDIVRSMLPKPVDATSAPVLDLLIAAEAIDATTPPGENAHAWIEGVETLGDGTVRVRSGERPMLVLRVALNLADLGGGSTLAQTITDLNTLKQRLRDAGLMV